MEFIKKIDHWVTKQGWDHQKFLQLIALAITLNLLLFVIWIFMLSSSGLIDVEFLQVTLKKLGISLLYGVISGLVFGFLELLPRYWKKQWDLHKVVPQFLLIHLFSLLILLIFINFLPISTFEKNGIGIGYALGGLFAILAYTGEVKIEHSNKDIKLIEE